MKSICVKSNNKYVIDYLLKDFSNIDLENVYLSTTSFRLYDNVIVHYTGDNPSSFYHSVCDVLTKCIFFFCEEKIAKKLIEYNYFYFTEAEKSQILSNFFELFSYDIDLYTKKYDIVFENLYQYLKENRSLVLSGFVNFRIKEYMNLIDENIDLCVNNYLIEREYFEFINMLHMYVNSKPSSIDHIHLVFINQESILLDEHKDIIPINQDAFQTKYLSDISFSTNDYCLNTLLTLLPKQLTIHLIHSFEDEFINTLKLIFENKVHICNDCDICRVYSITHNILAKK